jgi:hypothetical protein
MTTKPKESLEKLSDYVTITVEHHFTDAELLKKSSELAGLTAEIEIQEAKKKATGAEFKNKIDGLKAQAKLVAGNINNKWENQERACELYLDFERKIRLYDDKITGEHLKTEPFHQSDFEKRQLKMNLDAQIDENNKTGDFAEGDALDKVIATKKGGKKAKAHAEDYLIGDGLTRDRFGNLTDLPPADSFVSVDEDEDLPIE